MWVIWIYWGLLLQFSLYKHNHNPQIKLTDKNRKTLWNENNFRIRKLIASTKQNLKKAKFLNSTISSFLFLRLLRIYLCLWLSSVFNKNNKEAMSFMEGSYIFLLQYMRQDCLLLSANSSGQQPLLIVVKTTEWHLISISKTLNICSSVQPKTSQLRASFVYGLFYRSVFFWLKTSKAILFRITKFFFIFFKSNYKAL